MLLSVEILLIVSVALMVAWNVQARARNTIVVVGMVLVGLGLILAASGTVGVEPVVPGRYTAQDLLIPIIAGIVIGLAVRLVDRKWPERIRMPQVNVNLSPDPAVPHVMNASAPRVVGMNTSAPPAEGGLL